MLGMKEQDAGLLKVLGPLAGDALRLSGYDKNGVSVALNPVDSKIYEVGLSAGWSEVGAVTAGLRRVSVDSQDTRSLVCALGGRCCDGCASPRIGRFFKIYVRDMPERYACPSKVVGALTPSGP